MKYILLTGFEPFDGEPINPSWELARALHGAQIDGHEVVAVRLPCVFGESLDVMRGAIRRFNPEVAIALGQAGGCTDFSVERVAINIDDARIPDNAGRAPIDTPVVPGAPAAHFSTLPIKAIVAGLRAQGYPASVSLSAGTFVCNHVFFGLQHELAGTGRRSGFIHIPYLPQQAAKHSGTASLPLSYLIEGLRVAVALAASAQETHQGEGQLH
jgi:pyroglutamyl-peptidase